MAEKPVHEQVAELTASWNPPPVDKAMERIVGVPVAEGDGRATDHTPMEELNSHMNPGNDSIDAGLQYADDGDDEPEDEYDDLTNAELKEELKNRDLPVSGNHDELVQRLRDDDESDEDDEEGDDEE